MLKDGKTQNKIQVELHVGINWWRDLVARLPTQCENVKTKGGRNW